MAEPSGICGVDTIEKYGISPHLLCWIKQGNATVVGILGQGSSRSLMAQWTAPMENPDIGLGITDYAKGTAQAMSGATAITTFSTTQVWSGNSPMKFNLVLDFFAIDDAVSQVMRPLEWLEQFASPQVNGWSPFDPTNWKAGGSGNATGRIPQRVTLDIGRKMIIPECVIENVSIPLDKERDSSGNLIRAQVTIDVQTLCMLNRDIVSKTYI